MLTIDDSENKTSIKSIHRKKTCAILRIYQINPFNDGVFAQHLKFVKLRVKKECCGVV